MKKKSARLTSAVLPVFVIGTLQLTGCLSQRELAPPPPGGAYRSTNGGASFEQSVNVVDQRGKVTGYVASLALRSIYRVPASPNTVFVTAGSEGVIVSRDDGVSWQKMENPLAAVTDMVRLENGALLLSGTNESKDGVVVRSLDGGRSWKAVLTMPAFRKKKKPFFMELIKRPPPPPVYISSLAADPFHPGRVYAGSSTGDFFIGEQSGKVWHHQVTVPAVERIFASPHRDGEALLLVSGGKLIRFTEQSPAGEEEQEPQRTQELRLPADGPVYDLSYVRQFPDALLVGTGRGAFISRDRGETWLKLPVPVSTVATLRSVQIAVSPTNPNRLLISVDSVMYRSEDGGETWNTMSLNLPGYLVTDISINPDNAARVLLTVSPFSA